AQVDVDGPAAGFAAEAACGGPVGGLGQDVGQVAVRIFAPGAIVRVLGVVGGGAVEGGRRGVALLIPGPAVGLPAIAQRQSCIQIGREILDRVVALAAGDPTQRGVDVGAVRAVAVAVFHRGGHEAVLTQAEALPGRDGDGVAVADVP